MPIRSARRKQVRKNLKRQALARQERLRQLEMVGRKALAAQLKAKLLALGHLPSASEARDLTANVLGFESFAALRAGIRPAAA
jgi:hypothetical protein